MDNVFDLFPQNIKLISETIESKYFPNVDTVTVQAEAISIPPRQQEKTK